MAAPRCEKCIRARPGQRVVRGPNWWGGKEDGGSDFVGTVVSVWNPGTDSCNTTFPVEVRWDSGEAGFYRAGCTSRTLDLRLIDAGPSGLTFPNITCGFCDTKNVIGTRWKCANCADYNLCHPCYMRDKHNLEHEFFRYDEPGTTGVRVSSRKTSRKFQFYGIFPGAEVKSDEGDKTGTIGNVRGNPRLLLKTDAGKSWYNNTDEVNCSLKFTKAACAGFYYKDHMPVIAVPGHDPKDVALFKKNPKTLSKSDYVQLIDDAEEIHYWTGYSLDECFSVAGKMVQIEAITCGGRFVVIVAGKRIPVNRTCLIPLHEISRRTFRRSITTESKGLGYVLSKTTALHLACRSGEEDVVTALLMAEADLEEEDENGDRAVHYAAGCNQSKILKLLLNSEADIGACNKFNETALHVAIKGNFPACARLLAENIRAPDVNIQDNVGDTVLHSAINAGMEQEIISLLLQVPGVSVSIKNDNGDTPLHIAASKGNLRATQEILNVSTDSVDTKNKKNVTALYIAADNNQYEIAKTLLTQGHGNVDIPCGSDSKTALAAACARGCCDVVELLVESGADVNAPDTEGNAPLHLCVANREAVIQPSPSRARKLSLMAQILQEGSSQPQLSSLSMARLLASRGGDLQKKNKKGLTPTQLCDSTALIEALLFWNTHERATGSYSEQLSALINAKDNNGMVLLHREAINGRHHVAQLLLDQGYTAVDTVCDEGLKTALSIAVERGHCKFVELLIKSGADINKEDAQGNAPVHIALTSNHCKIARLLVAAGCDVNKQDAQGNAPLHISLTIKNCAIAETLVAAGADVNQQDSNGNTPLHISLLSRPAVKASKLSSTRAPKLKAIATELEKLQHAEINPSIALACFLISSGSSLKIKNARGLNPFNIADSMPLVRTLLKWAPKTREAPAGEASVERGTENDTPRAEGAPSSTENIGGPGLSEQQALCTSEKEEPQQEEIDDRHVCAICMETARTVAFLCGHGTCQECSTKIKQCHVCRAPVEKIIRLFEG